jgi:mannose-6-phosphate isomerase-like protein (cupin superfamily)
VLFNVLNRRQHVQIKNVTNDSNSYAIGSYGDLKTWTAFITPHPKFGSIPGKQFLRSELGLTSMEVSLNSLPPGGAIPFSHGHKQNEELYLFLSGAGQMLLDQEVIEVRAGTAVRVAPPVLRCWRNTGTDPLTCAVIQAKAGSLTQATATDGIVADGAPAWPR